MKLFMNQWDGCNPIVLDGTDRGDEEAASYQAKLKDVPVDSNGLPCFDLALIGVGDDGHIGSLYPNRAEVLETKSWVLPVAMKSPPSITLSLPVMANAKQVVVAACGVSDKYPQGKSEGMRRAILAPEETLTDVPSCRSTTKGYLDYGQRPLQASWVTTIINRSGENFRKQIYLECLELDLLASSTD
jgi:6-phosphogluconolactonase